MASNPLNVKTLGAGAPLSLRRLRQNSLVRELVREHRVSVEQLIQPHFVVEGISARESVPGLTGTFREIPDTLLRQIEADLKVGVSKILLFGVPAQKKLRDFDPSFTAAQIAAIRKRFGAEVFISVDVCPLFLRPRTDSAES